jgi:hypothetical protein
MIPILNHRSIGTLGAFNLCTVEPETDLADTWALVVRESVWRNWGNERPEFSPLAHASSFERIVRSYGSPHAFDELVKELVGDGFFSAWRSNKMALVLRLCGIAVSLPAFG